MNTIDCLCCWNDLLGYGNPFIESNWDFSNELCKINFDRLENIEKILVHSFEPYDLWTILQINDGVVKVHDINKNIDRWDSRLIYALLSVTFDFNTLNAFDKKDGHPGVRGVLTWGKRIENFYPDQTINSMSKKVTGYHLREFQMNSAFSKAYIMEASGSKAGLAGAFLFVDYSVLSYVNDNLPAIEGGEYRVNEINIDGIFYYKIMKREKLMLELQFDANPIDYNNKGIETRLYKMIKTYSYVDEAAKEQAYNDMLRYSKMED